MQRRLARANDSMTFVRDAFLFLAKLLTGSTLFAIMLAGQIGGISYFAGDMQDAPLAMVMLCWVVIPLTMAFFLLFGLGVMLNWVRQPKRSQVSKGIATIVALGITLVASVAIVLTAVKASFEDATMLALFLDFGLLAGVLIYWFVSQFRPKERFG